MCVLHHIRSSIRDLTNVLERKEKERYDTDRPRLRPHRLDHNVNCNVTATTANEISHTNEEKAATASTRSERAIYVHHMNDRIERNE